MTNKPLEERLTLRLIDLKQAGYLNGRSAGYLPLQLNGRQYGEVRVDLTFAEDETEEEAHAYRGQIELRYERPSASFYQCIELVRLASNLGGAVPDKAGGVWYFLCPLSGERCRVLYLSSRGFCGRRGLPQARYASQQWSRSERAFEQRLRELRKAETLLELIRGWLCKPGIKRRYGGQLTRPMQRLLKLRAAVEGIKLTQAPATNAHVE